MAARPWTPEEDRILIEAYTRGGMRLSLERLPGRTVSSIRLRVQELKDSGVDLGPGSKKPRALRFAKHSDPTQAHDTGK